METPSGIVTLPDILNQPLKGISAEKIFLHENCLNEEILINVEKSEDYGPFVY